MFGSEQNVRVRSGTEPEPLFGFMFGGFAEPNPEHYVQFGFEHCSQCSEPDCGQSSAERPSIDSAESLRVKHCKFKPYRLLSKFCSFCKRFMFNLIP